MLNLNADEFIKRLYNADEWVTVMDQSSGRWILTTRNTIAGSDVVREERFLGPDLVDMTQDEWIVFRQALDDVLEQGTGPKRLIGYKIGDKLYHPDDVELVYAHDYAKPKSDATSTEGSIRATQWQHSERRSGDWEDEDSDGVLRNTGALG